jgi:hypothetical protein
LLDVRLSFFPCPKALSVPVEEIEALQTLASLVRTVAFVGLE